jgi:hypothetical protein
MKLKLKLLCERNGISDCDIAWEWEVAVLGKATTVDFQAQSCPPAKAVPRLFLHVGIEPSAPSFSTSRRMSFIDAQLIIRHDELLFPSLSVHFFPFRFIVS